MEERLGNLEDGISGLSRRKGKSRTTPEACLEEMRVCVLL